MLSNLKTAFIVFLGVLFLNNSVEAQHKNKLVSYLHIYHVDSVYDEVVYLDTAHFEAPNWSYDGRTLFFNEGGRIYTIPVEGGNPTLLATGVLKNCNNDHVLSPGGSHIGISNESAAHNHVSLIYLAPTRGGMAFNITPKGPSYLHGWSPDGYTLAYCGKRKGNYDIYTIPIKGGDEVRLTDAPGLDDGPDYSPDGKYIWFNSERTGSMKLWRMNSDGSNQQQMTFGEYNDWFPHPSPDGKYVVFLSYDKSVKGHPANKKVWLRIMSADGGDPQIILELFGGQGTLNVPSWSPDSRSFAYVSYKLVK